MLTQSQTVIEPPRVGIGSPLAKATTFKANFVVASVRITFSKAQFQEPKGFKIMMFMFAIALSLYGTGHKFSWHVLHLSQVIKVSSFNPCWQSECFSSSVQKLKNKIFACNTIGTELK